ncbi:MAG: arylsulfatase [Bryobacterales bacterium]|nr:arylsulfatase [Bryobacterales bacterium]
MRRRDFFGTLAASPLLAQRTKPPNIVLILADDLGWADVGFHRSEIRTPNLDRLARQSMEMDRFYVMPLCSPTRSALMTGRNPIRFGVSYATIEPFDNYGVPVEERFLPQTLHDSGYETAIAGKWHLGHRRIPFLPNSRGFDHSYGLITGRIDYYTKDREGGYDWHRNLRTLREEGYSTELIGREASRLIKARDRKKPLFLYVPFNAPHTPLQPPPKFMDDYAGIQDPDRRTFAAMTAYMDFAIGKILQSLDDEGMANNTLLMFFSDNGGPTGNGARNTPLRGGKRTGFEGGIRVPCLLRWPERIKAGSHCGQVTTVMDLMPTLAAVAGTTPGNKLPLDGRNMWPAISSGKVVPREEEIFFGTGSDNKFLYSIFHKEWKLVSEIPRKKGEAVHYLFRVGDDPEEKNDLAARHPEIVKDLAARIEKWRNLYPPDGIMSPKKTAAPGEETPATWVEAAVP